MNVLNSQMHVITVIFVGIELLMLGCRINYLLNNLAVKERIWYVLLLILLINYNIMGSVFPDPHLSWPIELQNILDYGSAFLMAAYFPVYFYKVFDLKRLKWHARYGSFLFFGLPFLGFFMLGYGLTGDFELNVRCGMVIPIIYGMVLLGVIFEALLKRAKEEGFNLYEYSKTDVFITYFAVVPWLALGFFAYADVPLWIESLVTNSGFLMLMGMLIWRAMKQGVKDRLRLELLEELDDYPSIIEANCGHFKLTGREILVADGLMKHLTVCEIADKLFMAPETAKKHIAHIYSKTGANKRSMFYEIMTKR